MDEKQDTKKEEPESTAEDTGKGDKYETTPIIERAREERERMEKVRDELRIENDRREKLQSQAILGGDINAGTPKEEPKEETPLEYADKIMSGEANPETKDAS